MAKYLCPYFQPLKEENCCRSQVTDAAATPAPKERRWKVSLSYFQPPQRRKLLSIASHSTLRQHLRKRKGKIAKYLVLFSTASKKKIAVDRKSLDAAATPAPKEKVSLSLSTASKRKLMSIASHSTLQQLLRQRKSITLSLFNCFKEEN